MHQTMGVDLFVTGERVMLLDAQPVLSSSVMDHLLSHEKSLPPDMTSAEICNEIQVPGLFLPSCLRIQLAVS